jgi:diguanylate cyclase (GGDEF)-like protein
MMVITMCSALIGDLIVLPSLMLHVELVTIWDLIRLKMGKDPREGIPLFDGLSKNQVHYILMAGALKNYPSGRVIFRKGETSDSMYAIISGELEVVDIMDETDADSMLGTKKLINVIGKGDVVGEMGMVRSCQRSATVIATAQTELLQINKRMIRRLHWLYPPTAQKFFFNLMSIVCNRLEFTTQCLSDATTMDSLTGLHNRDYFLTLLEKEIDRVKRYGSQFSVIMMDLDNFKGINHTYGHDAGDRILSEMGLFLQKHVRISDQACRYSGQRFALMLVNSNAEKTRRACERFRKLLSEHTFESHGAPVFITASMGYVASNHAQDRGALEYLDMAAQALQRAKENGKNRVEGLPEEG